MTRIILVRQTAASGSSCCGSVDEPVVRSAVDPFRHDAEVMGALYRELRRRHPDVDVQVCDPRNTAWLVPTIWHDARRRGLRGREVFEQLRRGVGRNAVIVDGLVLHWGDAPAVDAVLEAVAQELAAAGRVRGHGT